MVEITIPGSKSITQRAIVCASLANGESLIKNPLICEDSEYLIKGLGQLGIKIKALKNSLKVFGIGGVFGDNGKCKIFMGNNGTGYRFLLSLANFYKNQVILSGNNKLEQRPIKGIVDALLKLGFNIEYIKKEGFPPVKIYPVSKKISSKAFTLVDVSKSSQFLSSLLISGVLFKKGIEVEYTGDVVSKPYINITLNVMRDFGVEVLKNKNRFYIPENSIYAGREYNVEGDFSSASYFISVPFFIKKELKIKNINYNESLQGDKHFIDVLRKMGGKFDIYENEIVVKPAELKGIEVDMNKMPDVVPTLSVLATIAKGETVIKNIRHLKYKETDRIKAIFENLKKLGIYVERGDNYLKIKPFSNFKNIGKVIIEPYDDHRIAMSFALISLITPNINISNKNCVKKSFPDFWKLFETLF